MKRNQEWTKTQVNFVLREYQKGHGRRSIAKLYNERFSTPRSPDSIQQCLDRHSHSVERKVDRVLIIDIETRALTTKTWGLWDQNIGLNQVVDDGGILCFSAKFLGENKTYFFGTGGKVKNEKKVITAAWKLMSEATIVLGQNSNQFDIKKLNAKFLEYGLGDPGPYRKLDTKIIAKRHFSFISNKLEYLSKKYNKKFKKLSHSKFPGYELWDQYEKGNKQALIEMEAYNKADVLATEEVFLELAKFDKTKTTKDALLSYNYHKKLGK